MRLVQVKNKKIANIFLKVVLFTLEEILAPRFAVKTLVIETSATIAKFT